MDRGLSCEFMIRFKEDGIPLGAYFGVRWIILKALLATLAFVILLCVDRSVHFVAWLFFGYLIGVVTSGVRSYLVAKRNWMIQREVTDWAKVERYAEMRG